MNVQLPVVKPALTVIDNHPITTSLDVAAYFGKLHKNVIQKIISLDCSPEFNELNFKPVDYLDTKSEKRPMYQMTKDGFMFLVMGFTGKKASKLKEAYITAFNEMELRFQKNAGGLSELEKYKMLNAMIKQLDMTDTAVVLPYIDIANLIRFTRAGQEAANRLERCSTNVELSIKRMKEMTGYHLADC